MKAPKLRTAPAPRAIADEELGAVSGGGASFSSLTVSKQVDQASPSLLRACCSGRHIDEVKLALR